jgi:hypothetical protein
MRSGWDEATVVQERRSSSIAKNGIDRVGPCTIRAPSVFVQTGQTPWCRLASVMNVGQMDDVK